MRTPRFSHRRTWTALRPWIGLALLFAWLAAGCAQALPQPAATEAPAASAETAAAAPAVTEAPAAAYPPAGEVQVTPETSPPATQPAPTPLATAPLPTPVGPQAAVEDRRVELEWPDRLRLGESDVVRLALIPASDGYTLEAEFPEHQVQTQPVPIPRPQGFDLFALARLDGVGFDLAPAGGQEQYLPPGEPVLWRWTLTPRQAGRQRLVVSLSLVWKPASGAQAGTRSQVVFSRSLDVRVTSFLGLSHSQALSTGLYSLVFGTGLSLAALAAGPRRGSRRRLEARPANESLAIELPPGLALLPAERRLLQALFHRYARLVVEQEFLSGYSGARTFLVRPVRADGQADAPTIAKLGERGAIETEFDNYETFVKDRLPPVTARIQHPPVTTSLPASPPRAALQYTFIGAPGSRPVSLRQALLANADPLLLRRLFETFGPNWWLQRRPYTFRLAQEYDRLLPPHLVVAPASGAGRALPSNLAPGALDFEPGERVQLGRFPHAEPRLDGNSLSLVGEPPAGQPPLRVRWLSLAPPEHTTGQVVATRLGLLRELTAGFSLEGLPDPLARLPALLDLTVSGTRSIIHGDLNLENILVGPGGLPWLIDFAQTREGHPLLDFAHLEAEVIAHILAPQVASPADFLNGLTCAWEEEPTVIFPFVLLSTLHEIAGRCAFNPASPQESQLALALACLGALKHANLDAHARRLLYLTAAFVASRL